MGRFGDFPCWEIQKDPTKLDGYSSGLLLKERVKGLRVKVVTLQREPKGAVTHPFGQEKAERKYS